jgi:UDP-galactopyranose mutase
MPHVVRWISQFADFVPYTHRVRAALPNGLYATMPINLDTVNTVFGKHYETAEQVSAHLRSVALPIAAPANAAEYLYSKIGIVLTDLLYRPYTKKMWAMDLEDMSAAVMKRLPLRIDRADTYFSLDDIQMMPRDGYTRLFEELLNHRNITLTLNKAFEKTEQNEYQFCFSAMAIDEYFDFVFGKLPYRSLRFHHRTSTEPMQQNWSVTNFTDDGPFTREAAWHIIPCHIVRDTGRYTLTREEPCDYTENNFERFYPVKTADDRFSAIYEQYRALADREPNIAFIGRCGTYQYLDMDQVINQSLQHVKQWITWRG